METNNDILEESGGEWGLGLEDKKLMENKKTWQKTVRKKIEVEGEQIEKKKKCVEKSGEKSEKNYAEWEYKKKVGTLTQIPNPKAQVVPKYKTWPRTLKQTLELKNKP